MQYHTTYFVFHNICCLGYIQDIACLVFYIIYLYCIFVFLIVCCVFVLNDPSHNICSVYFQLNILYMMVHFT